MKNKDKEQNKRFKNTKKGQETTKDARLKVRKSVKQSIKHKKENYDKQHLI